MAFPLSSYLVDPDHALIWLSQHTTQELRELRLVWLRNHYFSLMTEVSRSWNSFIMGSESLWRSRHRYDRPVSHEEVPELNGYEKQ
jgi:hypothetical protein